MLAYERGEHLHHDWVVFARVVSDAFEGVDTADAHVNLVRAELLDRLRVAVGYLPFEERAQSVPVCLTRVLETRDRHCHGASHAYEGRGGADECGLDDGIHTGCYGWGRVCGPTIPSGPSPRDD